VNLSQLLQDRRSVREFTTEPVTDEQITALLTAAQLAPSAGNRQPWHFYVIRTPDLKTRIANDAASQPFIGTAPVVVVACVEPELNQDRYADRGRDLYSLQDVAAALENLWLTAVDLGLAACWCGGFDEAKAAEILQLPANRRPVAIVPIGHRQGELPDPRPRRPLCEIATFC